MNISPLDIRKHEFKKSFRGYDVDEVTAFLDMVSIEYESLVRDNALLNEKVKEYSSQLKKYHDIEGTLQETLLSAERAREETVEMAKKQAEVIIREAEVKAASIIEEGRVVFSRLRNTIDVLKVQKEAYIIKIKALVNAQLEIFDKISFIEEEKIETFENVLGNEDNFQKEPEVSNQNKKNTKQSPNDRDMLKETMQMPLDNSQIPPEDVDFSFPE